MTEDRIALPETLNCTSEVNEVVTAFPIEQGLAEAEVSAASPMAQAEAEVSAASPMEQAEAEGVLHPRAQWCRTKLCNRN